MKDLADRSGHIINATSPLFGREQPERCVALWIQVDDQNAFVMICSQTRTNVDSVRGLTDAAFEIDERDYLTHLVAGWLRRDPLNQTDLVSRNE